MSKVPNTAPSTLPKMPNKTLKSISNTLKKITPKKLSIVLPIICVSLIAIGIGIFVYMYFTYIWTENVQIDLFENDDPIDGRHTLTFEDALVLSNTNKTYSCTFCFWLYLKSLPYNSDKSYNILSYEVDNEANDYIDDNTHFTILYDNVLRFRFNTMKDQENIDIKDLYLQKWTCIQVVFEDQRVDIYIDGVLTRSKSLKYIPILSDKGNLFIGKDAGFNGNMSKLTYFNYALSQSDLKKYYKLGR